MEVPNILLLLLTVPFGYLFNNCVCMIVINLTFKCGLFNVLRLNDLASENLGLCNRPHHGFWRHFAGWVKRSQMTVMYYENPMSNHFCKT